MSSDSGRPALSVIFLGFTVPRQTLESLGPEAAVAATQTHNFAWSIVDALGAEGCRVGLLSTVPVRSFPGHRKLVFRGGRFQVRELAAGQLLGFLNLHVVKQVCRFIGCCLVGLRFVREAHASVMVLHGVHLPYLWFARLAKRLQRLPIVVVMTDPPGVVLPSDSVLMRALRQVDARLVRRSLRRVDGVVCLTKELGEDYAPSAPRLVMEGIVSRAVASHGDCTVAAGSSSEPFVVAYAGALKETYGVKRLVEAVQTMRLPIRLDVYGSGPLAAWLQKRAVRDERIEFHGPIAHGDLLTALQMADLLVNPRPIDESFVRYSFPSKLIEYMALGKPVLTTRLPGIPSDYEGRVVFAPDDSVNGLAKSIEGLAALSPSKRQQLGRMAREFVLTEKSISQQGGRLTTFLGQVLARSSR